MKPQSLSSYRIASKIVRHLSNIRFLRTCKSLKLIPNGLRAPNILRNITNSPLAEKLAMKHSRQWLQLAIDTQYYQLRGIRSSVFPLNQQESEQIQRLENTLEETKQHKLHQLQARQRRHLAADKEVIKPVGFQNLSSEVIDPKLKLLLRKRPSFVNPDQLNFRNNTYFQEQVYNSLLIS